MRSRTVPCLLQTFISSLITVSSYWRWNDRCLYKQHLRCREAGSENHGSHFTFFFSETELFHKSFSQFRSMVTRGRCRCNQERHRSLDYGQAVCLSSHWMNSSSSPHDSMQCLAASEASVLPPAAPPPPPHTHTPHVFSCSSCSLLCNCTRVYRSLRPLTVHSLFLVLCPWLAEDFLSIFHLDIRTKSEAHQNLSQAPVLKFHGFLPTFWKVSTSYIFLPQHLPWYSLLPVSSIHLTDPPSLRHYSLHQGTGSV